jgi:hypothetical protein
MKLRLVSALAFAAVLCAFGGRAHAQMPAGPALVVDARLGFGAAVTGTSGIIAVPSLDVGVRLINRLQVGLGFGIFRAAQTMVTGANITVENANTSFTFIPMATFDILKSRDNHVAFYGKAGLPLGAAIVSTETTTNNTSTTVSTNHFVIGYDFALGARYCPHPNFAVGLEGGLSGIFLSPTGNASESNHTFYGALVGTFYWGKGT